METLYVTSFENFGAPCGYDVTYSWTGKNDFTFTINTNEALYKTSMAFLAVGALELLF